MKNALEPYPLKQEKQSAKDHPSIAEMDADVSFEDLFLAELKDLYCAEQKLAHVVPNIGEHLSSRALAFSFSNYLDVLGAQELRLATVFSMLDEDPTGGASAVIDALIEELENPLSNIQLSSVRDAAVILAVQRIAHYKITTYGTLHAFALVMGRRDLAALLHESLYQENEAELKFEVVASTAVNPDAAFEQRMLSRKA